MSKVGLSRPKTVLTADRLLNPSFPEPLPRHGSPGSVAVENRYTSTVLQRLIASDKARGNINRKPKHGCVEKKRYHRVCNYHLADCNLICRHIRGLARCSDGERKIREVPKHGHGCLRKMQRPI